jgi:hypothetical protein
MYWACNGHPNIGRNRYRRTQARQRHDGLGAMSCISASERFVQI